MDADLDRYCTFASPVDSSMGEKSCSGWNYFRPMSCRIGDLGLLLFQKE